MKKSFCSSHLLMRHMLLACCLLQFFVGCDDASSSPESDGVTVENNVFVDKRDGNEYKVFNVGSDVWMAENLRYADSSKSANLKGNMWCPDGEASNCKEYGPLYSWTAARDIPEEYSEKIYGKDLYKLQGICPDGFRLPTNDEWIYLKKVAAKYAGAYSETENLRSPEGWASWGSDIHIYDSDWYGIDFQPAGRRNIEGGFLESGLFAFFWTADEIDEATASGWTLRDDNDVLDSGKYYKGHGMSVRCLVEDPENINWVGDAERVGFSFSYGTLEIDGQKYKTLVVGHNEWMVENANVETEHSRCYKDDDRNCKKYGRLYSAEDAALVCPEGWKIPSTSDWNNLYADANQNTNSLKAVGEWNNSNATNSMGFSALPSGVYDNGSFSDLTISANYWMTDFYGEAPSNMGMTISYYNSSMTVTTFSSNTYASVRCVKDIGRTTWLD